MPKLRLKRWQYFNSLNPHVIRCPSGRIYINNGSEGGVIDVPFLKDIDHLLKSNYYDFAWEYYGISFDSEGNESKTDSATTDYSNVANDTSPKGNESTTNNDRIRDYEDSSTPEKRKRSRPRKK